LCLAVQFAKKIEGTNTFDWQNGLMFNLLDKELMEVTALFLGYNREFKLKNNGKFLDFVCQSTDTPRVYLKAGSGKLFFNVPVANGHVPLASIKLLGFCQHILGGRPEFILESIRACYTVKQYRTVADSL